MQESDHLVLRELALPAATEWTAPHGGWIFLRWADGEGMALGNGTSHLVSRGEVVVGNPAHACRIRASQLGAVRLEYFGVEASLLAGVLSAWERQHLDAVSAQVVLQRFAADNPVARQFAELCADPRPARLTQRCRMLQLAAPVLTSHLPAAPTPPAGIPTAQTRFEKLVQQLSESELTSLSPADLAKRCGCSVRHFSRLFRSHFGRSLKPRQNELRLDKACELLRETDAKIIEVAFEAGFQHVGLFTTYFKRRFGVTPSVWRRRQQGARRR
jgi:AraC-like DNA-binding protein